MRASLAGLHNGRISITIVLAALGLSACGGSDASSHRPVKPTSSGAHSAQVAVVRAWAEDLLAGHIDAAAAYFAVPSVFENGQTVEIRSVADARAVNASLPCGAKYVSATWTGKYVNVLFRLAGRPGPGGTSCSGGVGQTARTVFLIVHGKIAVWIRAPDIAPKPGSGSGAPNQSPTNPIQSPPVQI